MSEESRTHDLVELSYRRLDAVNRRDLEAVVSFFAADAVWDMSPIDMGIFAGRAAIRNALKTWWETFPAIVSELDEVLDLGSGVVLQAVTQRGRPTGSTSDIRQRSARVLVVVDGLIETLTSYNDIDEAPAAAERLAEERG
jgi:ketosteroid isomerase-like protein